MHTRERQGSTTTEAFKPQQLRPARANVSQHVEDATSTWVSVYETLQMLMHVHVGIPFLVLFPSGIRCVNTETLYIDSHASFICEHPELEIA